MSRHNVQPWKKKNKSNAIVTHPRPGNNECMVKPGIVPEYKPFVSQGTVSLVSGEESPVTKRIQ